MPLDVFRVPSICKYKIHFEYDGIEMVGRTSCWIFVPCHSTTWYSWQIMNGAILLRPSLRYEGIIALKRHLIAFLRGWWYSHNIRKAWIYSWSFCSFSKELDVMVIPEEIYNIKSNVKINLSEWPIDNWMLHWCTQWIHIILDYYLALVGDKSLLIW